MPAEDMMDDEIRRFVEPIGFVRLTANMARTCRFAGAGLSSLKHSIIVGDLLPREAPVIRLGAYLHDAGDGLHGEVPNPFKTSQQADLEERIWQVWMGCMGLCRVVKQLSIDCGGQIALADRDAGNAEYVFLKHDIVRPPGGDTTHTPVARRLVRHWAGQSAKLARGYWLGTVQGLIGVTIGDL